jgi:excisionase family DNA binding protein
MDRRCSSRVQGTAAHSRNRDGDWHSPRVELKLPAPRADSLTEEVNHVHHVDHVIQVDYPLGVPTKEQQAMALMQVREAARALGVSENTIRRWEQRGLILAVRLPSGVRRFRPEDIEAAKSRMYEGLPPLAEGDDVVSVSKATPID